MGGGESRGSTGGHPARPQTGGRAAPGLQVVSNSYDECWESQSAYDRMFDSLKEIAWSSGYTERPDPSRVLTAAQWKLKVARLEREQEEKEEEERRQRMAYLDRLAETGGTIQPRGRGLRKKKKPWVADC